MKRFFEKIRNRGPFRSLIFVSIWSAVRYFRREFHLRVIKYIYGIRIGDKCHIGSGLRFIYPQNITIGNSTTIAENTRLWSEKANGRLIVQDGVSVARDCVLDFSGGLILEENSLPSEGVIVYTHDHGHDPRSKPSASPLIIGKNSWIGVRAIILPSVSRIGERALIGAGAVVTKDVPDGGIFVGASGRFIQKD